MKKLFLIYIISFGVLNSEKVFAWGGRGHNSICMAAPHLIKTENLKNFLIARAHILGHLCNIPDIYWKSLGPKVGELGNSTHFIESEIIGLKLSEVPLNFQEIKDKYTGTENKSKPASTIFSISKEMGSLWWRVDQFVNLVSNLKNDFNLSQPPQNSKEEQNETLPYNSSIYKMIIYMGILGHFVGDASQPFHNTVDYDGYETGHGGIHAYYEELSVSHFSETLESDIIKTAKKLKELNFLTSNSTLQNMKALSELSLKDKEQVLKLDPIIKKSDVKKDKGMEIRTAAERKPASEGFKVYQSLILKQMARSALLLAHFWESSYEASGKMDLSKYRSYKYPFTPDFIEPNY